MLYNVGEYVHVRRAPVSMGAVGASAPTVFESVGASTHGFWQFFSHFLSVSMKMIWKKLRI